jgi:hypothetical protein
MLEDRFEIRELVERWVLWRDAGEWERFRTLWHDDGRMTATWITCGIDEFIRMSKAARDRGMFVAHSLGAHTSDVAGNRAIAQTKMTIAQRGPIEGVQCDIVCTGRFYDFLERRDERWGLVLRRVIYEYDRADPIDSATYPAYDRTRLESYPAGYRHLAYFQAGIGLDVATNLPGASGPELEALYRDGKAWLENTQRLSE